MNTVLEPAYKQSSDWQKNNFPYQLSIYLGYQKNCRKGRKRHKTQHKSSTKSIFEGFIGLNTLKPELYSFFKFHTLSRYGVLQDFEYSQEER